MSSSRVNIERIPAPSAYNYTTNSRMHLLSPGLGRMCPSTYSLGSRLSLVLQGADCRMPAVLVLLRLPYCRSGLPRLELHSKPRWVMLQALSGCKLCA